MSHEDQEEITWVPFREPVRNTLARTVGLALIIGSVIAWTSHGRLSWPVAVLVALWPALGGHFVELWFLNVLRPRLSASRGVQVSARVITWAVAGVVMLVAMRATASV